MRFLFTITVGLAILTAGCGSGGPARYQISGEVTCDGKPIPVGMVYFIPDTAKGNEGPGSGAEIKNGKYITPPNGGIVAGPMIVKIDGYDGISQNLNGEIIPNGAALFPTYETTVEFEKEAGVRDFAINKDEAIKAPKSKPGASGGFVY